MSTAPPTSATMTRSRAPRRLLAAMLAAAVLASGAAYGAVQVLDDHGAPIPAPGTPAVVAQQDVAAVASAAGHDVYGIPAPAGTRLEVTRGNRGEVWVRYLTGSARPGDHRADFLTIGTYRRPDAYAAATKAAGDGDQRSVQLPGGGIMLWSLERPTSVYLARPGSDLLVEVYSPDAEQARALARSGAVTPLR